MPPPNNWTPAQSLSVSTESQLVSTSINSVSSWLSLSSDSSREMTFFGCLWCRSRHNNFLRHKSFLISQYLFCFSVLLFINHQALICTASLNQFGKAKFSNHHSHKATNVLLVLSACGMERIIKTGQLW